MIESPAIWNDIQDSTVDNVTLSGTRIRTRKLTESEILSQPEMRFVHGRGFVPIENSMMGSSYSADEQDGSLPLNPTYNNYLSRDLSAASFFEYGYRRNSIIFGLVNIRCVAIQQAPLVIYLDGDENEEQVDDAPIVELFANPNPYFDFKKIMAHLEGFGCLGGNSYLYTPRNDYGLIESMYQYNASQITPIGSLGKWLSHYVYDNGAGFSAEIPADNIMRSDWLMSEWQRPMKSIPPLAALATEIDVDNSRKVLDLATLQNGAIPAMMVTVPPKKNLAGVDTPWTQMELDILAQKYNVKFSGRNINKVMFAPQDTQVNVLGFDPRKMQTNATAELPETRACHALQIPLQMTSLLMSGKNRTYNNYEQALLSLYRDTMIPRYGVYAEMFNRFFGKEVFKGDRRKYKFKFDYSQIPILRKDIVESANAAYEGNMSTLNEARLPQGLPPDTTLGEQYLFQLTAQAAAGQDVQTVSSDEIDEQRAKEVENIKQQAKKGRARII
jgi:HK97 family phage portal protein